MIREITTHQIPELPAGQYAELRAFAFEGDQFGVPHHYVLGQREDNALAADCLVRKVEMPFQSGDPRKGWNGGTSLAYLACVLDFLEKCETTKFACPENAKAIEHLRTAMGALQERIARRHREGTFQTHAAGAGETTPKIGKGFTKDLSMCPPFQRAFTEWERRYRETPEEFMSDFKRFTSSEQTYGESAAAYFVSLLDELSDGKPWNTITAEPQPTSEAPRA